MLKKDSWGKRLRQFLYFFQNSAFERFWFLFQRQRGSILVKRGHATRKILNNRCKEIDGLEGQRFDLKSIKKGFWVNGVLPNEYSYKHVKI